MAEHRTDHRKEGQAQPFRAKSDVDKQTETIILVRALSVVTNATINCKIHTCRRLSLLLAGTPLPRMDAEYDPTPFQGTRSLSLWPFWSGSGLTSKERDRRIILALFLLLKDHR